MVDLFGRAIEESPPQELSIPAEHIGCFGGCGVALPEAYPFPIIVLGETWAVYLCSDVCALAAGLDAPVRTRQIGEEYGFGWQVVTDPDGRLIGRSSDLPDDYYAATREEAFEQR